METYHKVKIVVDGELKKILQLDTKQSLSSLREKLAAKMQISEHTFFVGRIRSIEKSQERDIPISDVMVQEKVRLSTVMDQKQQIVNILIEEGEAIEIQISLNESLRALRKKIESERGITGFYYKINPNTFVSKEEEEMMEIEDCLEHFGITIILQKPEPQQLGKEDGETAFFESAPIIDQQFEKKIEQKRIQQNDNNDEIVQCYNLSQLYPHSLECSLLQLIFFVTCKSSNRLYIQDITWELIDNSIDKEIHNLSEFTYIDSGIQTCIDNFEIYKKNNQWDLLLYQLRQLKTKLMPVIIQYLKQLLDIVDVQSKKLIDQDVILFLGQTGSGKSTSILYLTGSKMQEMIIEQDVLHIGAEKSDIVNEDAKLIQSNPFTQSVTKNITAVRIRDRLGNDYILTDTCGFGDLSGPEVDIANGVSTIKAIQAANSVRPVLVMSEKSSGDRLQGIKEISQILAGMIHPIQDQLETFTFIFTKFQRKEQLYPLLKDLKNHLNGDDLHHISYLKVLDSLLEAFEEKKVIFLNPLDQDSNKILKQITRQNPISNPSNVFKRYLTPSSAEKLISQAQLHSKVIRIALDNHNYNLILHKANELKIIKEALGDQQLNQIYEETIQQCNKKLLKMFEEATKKLSTCFDLKNDLSEKDLIEFEKLRQKDQEAENFKKAHLNHNSQDNQVYAAYIQCEAQDLRNKADSKVVGQDPAIYLKKLKVVAQFYSDNQKLNDLFNELVKKKDSELLTQIETFKELIQNNEWKAAFSEVSSIFKSMETFNDYIHNSRLEEMKQSINKSFINRIDSYLSKAKKVLKNESLSLRDAELIAENITDLQSIHGLVGSQNLIALDQFEFVMNKLKEGIQTRFDSMLPQAQTILNNNDPMNTSQLKNYFEQLELIYIHLTDALMSKSKSTYIELRASLTYHVRRLFESVKDKLTSIKGQLQMDVYEKVRAELIQLNNFTWLDNLANTSYTNIFSQFQKDMSLHSATILQSAMQITINLQDYNGLQQLAQFQKELSMISRLIVQEKNVSNHQEQLNDYLISQINPIFKDIENTCHKFEQIGKNEKIIFNAQQIERYLKFLRDVVDIKQPNLSSTFSDIKNDAQNNLDRFSIIAQNLCKKLDMRLNTALDNIKDKVNDTTTLSLSCSVLEDILMQLQQVEKTVILKELFEGNVSLINQFNQRVNAYVEELEFELLVLKQSKCSISTLKNKLTIANMFSNLASINCAEQFKRLKEEYAQLFTINLSTLNEDIRHDVKSQSFKTLFNRLEQMSDKKDDMIMAHQREALLKGIELCITNLVSEIQLHLRQTSNYQDPDFLNKLEQLVMELNKLKEAEQFQKYLSLSEDISDLLSQYQQKLNEDFRAQCQLTIDLVESYEFITTSIQMKQLNEALSIIKIWSDDESQSLYKKVIICVKETLERIKNKFQQMQIVESQSLSRSIMQKLDVIKDHQQFDAFFNEMYEIIRNKLHEEIDLIRKQQSLREKQCSYEHLNAFIQTLPDSMKETISESVKKLKKELKNEQRNRLQRYENAKNLKNFKELTSLLRDFKKDQQLDKYQEIFPFFVHELNSKSEEIQELLNDERLDQKHLESFYDLCIQFEANFEEENQALISIQRLLSERVKTDLKKYFNTNRDSQELNLEVKTRGSVLTLNDIMGPSFTLKTYLKLRSEKQDLFRKLFIAFDKILSKTLDKLIVAVRQLLKSMEQQSLQIDNQKVKLIEMSEIQQSLLKQNSGVLQKYLGKDEAFKTYVEQIQFYQAKFEKESKSTFQMMTRVGKECKQKCQDILQTGLQMKTEFDNYCDGLQNNFKELFHMVSLHSFYYTDYNITEEYEDCKSTLSQNIETILENVKNVDDNQLQDKSECENLNKNLMLLESLLKIDVKHRVVVYEMKQIYKNLDILIQRLTRNIERIMIDTPTEYTKIGDSLIQLNRIGIHIQNRKLNVNDNIEKLLSNYLSQNKQSGISKLAFALNKSPEGQMLTQECSTFKAYNISIFTQQTITYSIETVLNQLEVQQEQVDEESSKNMQKLYQDYKKEYDKLCTQYLSPNENERHKNINILVSNIKSDKIRNNKKDNLTQWTGSFKNNLCSIIAHISAIWTIQNSTYFFSADKNDNYLLQLHSGQIVALFRLFGLDRSDKQLPNNLVQIGTGEGKSIILAFASSILALLGFEVNCACYSEHLSQRDWNDFHLLFRTLNVQQYIFYGTFNQLCERIINEQFNLRQKVASFVTQNAQDNKSLNKLQSNKPKVLLIDEVDVFFSKEFYGELYAPQTSIKGPAVTELINYIWKNKESNLRLQDVQQQQEYRNCQQTLSQCPQLLDEAIKHMLYDLNQFDSHEYKLHNFKIGYKDQDNIVFNVNYGYLTLFAYFAEHEKGLIPKNVLDERISIGIKCGELSYAEIPKSYNYIMGTTGTLRTLSKWELDIIRLEYKITVQTFIPSVFGKNQLFVDTAKIKIANSDDFYSNIYQEIVNCVNNKRAVLVFFEDKVELLKFYNSQVVSGIKSQIKYVTEEATMQEKQQIINLSTYSGQITLFTRSFGRGTDFKQHDSNVKDKGGVHVIQTFLSEEISEEIQIKGRTARQGTQGSYSLIVLDTSLNNFGIESFEWLKNNQTPAHLLLQKIRNDYRQKQEQHLINKIKIAKLAHDKGMQILDTLYRDNKDQALRLLLQYNKGPEVQCSKTLVLTDATGSMEWCLLKTKHAIGQMFSRAQDVLSKNGMSPKCFSLQFAAFRNYSSSEENILQASPWTTKAEDLVKFLDSTKALNGMGREAIEVGLWHAHQESLKSKISQVILIGDAPPNTVAEQLERKANNKQHSKRLKDVKHYEEELKYFINEKIKVHAFYVHQNAKESFVNIATKTCGQHEFLDIKSTKGEDLLTNLVTQEILRNLGGEQLVQSYRKVYVE